MSASAREVRVVGGAKLYGIVVCSAYALKVRIKFAQDNTGCIFVSRECDMAQLNAKYSRGTVS